MLSWLFPRVCGICHQKINQNYACEKCWNILQYTLERELCVRHLQDNVDCLVSLFSYHGIVRQKILAYKFRDKAYLRNVFAELMSEVIEKLVLQFDVVIPIPIHAQRYKKRGYNQSELLAKKIAKKMKKKCQNHVLYKRNNTVPQSSLNEKQRQENVKNAYGIKKIEEINHKSVLLIDDIYTTGATVKECAKILKRHGASYIIVMTIAYSARNVRER